MSFRILFILCVLPISIFSQDSFSPVEIEFSLQSTDLSQKVIAEVTVEKGWYIYSSTTEKGGPVPTELLINELNQEQLGSLIEDGELIKVYDELFELEVSKYKNQVSFSREVDQRLSEVSGALYYMVCDSKRCLPPTKATFTVSK